MSSGEGRTMKVYAVFGFIIAVALGVTQGVCWGQPECVNVYLKTDDPVSDPPCDDGFSPGSGWSIHVTSSPSSISAGSCSSFTLDNLYTDVDFFEQTCGVAYKFTCDIVASGSTLSGYYELTDLGGGCLRVCATCTP
jgi:hypothetical protein